MNEFSLNQEPTAESNQARLESLRRQLNELSSHPEEDAQRKEELTDEIAVLEEKLANS